MATTQEQLAQQNQAIYAALRKLQSENQTMKKSQDELAALMRQVSDAPRWIEEIPGRRVPFIGGIELTVSANSTSRVEGTLTVSTDGPFVCTGVAMFWQRTSAPYAGLWGPATTIDSKIALAGQNLGFGYLLDQPHVGSFDVEINESGSDRNWQNIAFASAMFAPSQGGVYVLPVSLLVGRASVLTVKVTPTVAQTVAGKVAAYFLGYKIVQGDTYQP